MADNNQPNEIDEELGALLAYLVDEGDDEGVAMLILDELTQEFPELSHDYAAEIAARTTAEMFEDL